MKRQRHLDSAPSERRRAHNPVRRHYDGIGFGLGDRGTLKVDGTVVNAKKFPKTMPFVFPEDETFDVGQDTRTPLALIEYRYDVPFKFTGKIDKLTFKLEPFTP